MKDKIEFDVANHPIGHEFTVVQCEYCGKFYEPCGKEHKCKKQPKSPKKTNFDRITESAESLAQFLYVLADGCGCRCETCPLEETDDCGKKVSIIEWLQKECE